MFEKLVEELKNARENSKLSQEQLAKIIKIDLKFLQQLEQGDLSFLPELYIRAFLRDYAHAVHLDKEIIMKKYQLAKEGKPLEDAENQPPPPVRTPTSVLPPDAMNTPAPVPVIRRVYPEERPDTGSQNSKGLFGSPEQQRYLIIGAFALLLIAGIVYVLFFKDASPEIISEQPIEQTVQQQKRFEEPAEQKIQMSSTDSLMLKVEVLDSCWVQMVVDSATIIEKNYSASQEVIQSAEKSIKLNVGNSANVNIQVNSQVVEFTRQKRKPIKFLITREGVKQIFEGQ